MEDARLRPEAAGLDPPSAVKNGIRFVPVPSFNDADVAFGAGEEAYFPRRDLPRAPRQFHALADKIFFDGGELPELQPGIDRKLAIRAVQAWLSSFAPAHEAKIATVAYALWVWTTPEGELAGPMSGPAT